jgi:hypothetical protein
MKRASSQRAPGFWIPAPLGNQFFNRSSCELLPHTQVGHPAVGGHYLIVSTRQIEVEALRLAGSHKDPIIDAVAADLEAFTGVAAIPYDEIGAGRDCARSDDSAFVEGYARRGLDGALDNIFRFLHAMFNNSPGLGRAIFHHLASAACGVLGGVPNRVGIVFYGAIRKSG